MVNATIIKFVFALCIVLSDNGEKGVLRRLGCLFMMLIFGICRDGIRRMMAVKSILSMQILPLWFFFCFFIQQKEKNYQKCLNTRGRFFLLLLPLRVFTGY